MRWAWDTESRSLGEKKTMVMRINLPGRVTGRKGENDHDDRGGKVSL